MEQDWWIELENTYKERVAQRQELYAKHGKRVLDYLPGSELACKELMEMVLQYVCARYPQYFSMVDKCIFQNRILGTEQDVRSKHPLEVLINNIPEDFGITLRDDETGFYIFRAGVICSSIGWSVDEKIGLPLNLIHKPVPDYETKMQTSMERCVCPLESAQTCKANSFPFCPFLFTNSFFTKLPTDKPIQRGSWGFEVGQPLWLPKGDPQEIHHTYQEPSLKPEECYLRVDWQTLRRLPLSAAVVFNFKALFTPVTEFRDEAGIPALVAKILKEGKKSFMEYKNTWHVEHVVLPKMEEWAKEQVENGLVPDDWEIATLEEGPYFRDWEEKWHRQQGF